MSDISAYLEDLLDECGGFSKFQWIMLLSMFGSRLAPNWSMLMMTFAGAVPDWYCVYNSQNETVKYHKNLTIRSAERYPKSLYQKCQPPLNATTTTCSDIVFHHDMDTIVNEWALICSTEWISSTITTIQMGGLFVGGLLAGHLADYIGRKPAYFLSVVMLLILNIGAGFSTSWQMFAVFRFFLGLSIGFYLTVFYAFIIEFTPANRRAMIQAFPAWAFWAAIFGLLSMWLHDWRYLHFATAIGTLPWLLFWWVTPESFRYLVTRKKLKEAESVICKIAHLNGRPVPDLKLKKFANKEDDTFVKKKYSIKDLLTSPNLRTITFLLGIGWFSCGYGYYAISFGVQSLSGNLYLNMFLLSVVEVPSDASTFFLNNRFGRKRTTLCFFLLAGVAGIVVAVLQVTDLEHKEKFINGFALAAKIGVGAGWASLMLLTTESYPTVVRNIGFGLQNSMSRIGAMIAPQVVYLNKHVNGIMYFLFGGTMLFAALCTALVSETNKKHMEDAIGGKKAIDLTFTPSSEKSVDPADGKDNIAFDTKL